ncbi:FKBP-type peptidyl-prolyl cis-trans isomerase [Altererythrobacter sp.]|uniref:FKBP-type peptidyl-prolyl cis-trans isomerase n=1 Tax=Altererythrobacter sp. TaxID=1872480 RepID=UPI003D09181E
MAEVTRVPLQPIAKGSLTKLWLGIIIALLIGAGIAWAAIPKGVELDTITAGTGPNPGPEDVVFVKYTGKLADGTEFDKSQDIPLPVPGIFPEGNPLPLDQMVPGFREGALKMQKGGKYTLHIPSEKGYGANPPPGAPIPPNADLEFEVELVDFMSREDFQRRVGLLQQMMQQEGNAAGAPPPAPGQ